MTITNIDSIVQDERIMADGRPAHAWWSEIQILRSEKANMTEQTARANAILNLLEAIIRTNPIADIEKGRKEWIVYIENIDMLKHGMEIVRNPQKFLKVE